MNGIALSPQGLARTNDGGTLWTWGLESSNRGLFSMRFVDRQRGWIVGAESKVEDSSPTNWENHKPFLLGTEDGGTTWSQINLDQFLRSEGSGFFTFLSICSDRKGTVWLGSNAGIVQATVESNELRVLATTTTHASVNDLACDDLGEVWAVGDQGLIMHYQGKKWTSQQYPDGNAFYNKVRVIGKAVWLVGGIRGKREDQAQGLLLKTENGNAWESKTPPDAGLLTNLQMIGIEGWLVGGGGRIYHTKNGGTLWENETSPTKNDLFAIFVLDSKKVWIAGDKLTVLGLSTSK